MTNWFTVFLYELRRSAKRKAYLFMTFGIPLLAFLVLGGYMAFQEIRSESESVEEETEFSDYDSIGYFDATEAFAAPDENSPLYDFIIRYDTFEDGETALKEGAIDSLYVIESDYFDTGNVTLWLTQFSLSAQENTRLIKAFLVQSLAGDVEPYLIARLRYPVVQLSQNRIESDGAIEKSAGFGSSFILVYVFALALMISTLTASSYLMQSVVEEKESRIIEIILTSVKPFPLLLGKALAMGLLGLFQIFVWGVAIWILLNQASEQIVEIDISTAKPETSILALIYFFLGFAVVGSGFAMLGAISSSTREASQMSGWFVMPMVIPMIFSSLFATNPDGTIPVILSFLPYTAPLSMVMRSAISDVPLIEIILSIAVSFFSALFMIWMAGRIFRVSSLLSNAPLKIRHLPKLILKG